LGKARYLVCNGVSIPAYLSFEVKQPVKRQEKQFNAVLWRVAFHCQSHHHPNPELLQAVLNPLAGAW
jgi:hypothetical protein